MADDAETRRAREEAREMAEQKKLDRAYEKSRTTPYAKGGATSSKAPKRLKEGGLSWGAKTGIEEEAANEAFKKQYYKSGPVQGPSDDVSYQRAISSGMREARNEIRRETKGKAPKAYAKGGTASSRADGCCSKGKTRGKVY